LGESVSGGADKLSQKEFDAYQQAKHVADPRNGGDMNKAKAILETAGFKPAKSTS
jgi:hypothetical protein